MAAACCALPTPKGLGDVQRDVLQVKFAKRGSSAAGLWNNNSLVEHRTFLMLNSYIVQVVSLEGLDGRTSLLAKRTNLISSGYHDIHRYPGSMLPPGVPVDVRH